MALETLRPRPRFRWGIAALLTLGMVAVIISLVAVTTALEIQRRRAALYQELEHRGQLLASTLAETLADPLYYFDVDALADIAEMLQGEYGASDIHVYDAQGRLLADSAEAELDHYDLGESLVANTLKSGLAQSRWQLGVFQMAGPVVVGREVIGGFEFELDTSKVAAEIRAMVRRRIWEGLAMALAGAVVAYGVAQRVVRPVRRLVSATQRIGQGYFDFTADTRRTDEVGDLTRSFSHMAARLSEFREGLEEQAAGLEKQAAELEEQAEELKATNELLETEMAERQRVEAQFLQAQKMESVGRLAGGVAHDFNNLLTPIMGYAQLGAAQVPQDHPLQSSLEEIGKAAHRAANLTRQLLAFSRRQVIQPQVVNLNDLAADMEKMLHRLIGEDVQLTTGADAGLGLIKADPGQMEQVLLNLVVNARDAMPQGGSISIQTANATLDQAQASQHAGASPGQYVVLSVSDTGTGMTEEVKSHLFEPFFTTKGVGKGTGLGLATCYGIVQQSGGFIDVQSQVGSGTSFRVYLPRVEETPAIPKAVGGEEPSLTGRETVLLAEDEAGVRELVARVLESHGYTVLAAANGEAALQLAENHARQEIHLLLTDVIMPHMGGVELARRFAGLYPHAPILFTSGYTEEPIAPQPESGAPIEYIQKPFLPVDLARKVREVLDKYAPAGAGPGPQGYRHSGGRRNPGVS
jgi:signal transduction histidine kinase